MPPASVAYRFVAGPTGAATLDLDHRDFALAGAFVRPRGLAVATGDGSAEPIAAVAFDTDRSDPETVRLRAITVREDRRGEGIGSRLAAFARARLHERDWDRVAIAVATPMAYHALWKAGFRDTGRTTGLRERVLCHPPPAETVPYRTGLTHFLDHDPSTTEAAFVRARRDREPPASVDIPRG